MAGKTLVNVPTPIKPVTAKSVVADPIVAPLAALETVQEAVKVTQDVAKTTAEATIQSVNSMATEAASIAAEATNFIAPQTIAPAQATVVTTPVAITRQSAHAVMEKTMKTAEEFVSFGQGNVEAMMKCGQIWAAGVQDLSKSFAATAQAQLDQTVSTWKALAGVKSVKEAMELQSNLTRNSMGAAVTETGKLTDASMKLMEQTMAPITARVTLAVEKFSRTA